MIPEEFQQTIVAKNDRNRARQKRTRFKRPTSIPQGEIKVTKRLTPRRSAAVRYAIDGLLGGPITKTE